MIKIKKNNEMKRIEIAISGNEIIGFLPDTLLEIVDRELEQETDGCLKQELDSFEKRILEMYIPMNMIKVDGFLDEKKIRRNLLEMREFLCTDAIDKSNIIYHVKGMIDHLIGEVDKPVDKGSDDDKKKRTELIANRPNLAPPAKRSAKSSKCIR